MTSRDRAELQVAALIGAVLGSVTYYVVGSVWFGTLLCKLTSAVHGPATCYVVEADGSPYFSVRSLVPSSSAGPSINFGLFVNDCFPAPLTAALVGRGV